MNQVCEIDKDDMYLQTEGALQSARIGVISVEVIDGVAQRRASVAAASAAIRQVEDDVGALHVIGQRCAVGESQLLQRTGKGHYYTSR